jgi:hypothetical protein
VKNPWFSKGGIKVLVTVTMNVEGKFMDENNWEDVELTVREIIKDGCEVNFTWARYVRVDKGGITHE